MVVESRDDRAERGMEILDACTRSTSTSGRRSGGRRAGPALTPLPGRPPKVERGDCDAQRPGAGACYSRVANQGSEHTARRGR